MKMTAHSLRSGFTLIEISIVLVIIGLIVGGVLVGRDLIKSATVRSQISQIEQYQVAANTFKAKYDYLPGDISATQASSIGLSARGTKRGQGDGNGLIEGNCEHIPSATACTNLLYALSGHQGAGESTLFWVDLSATNLIGNIFNTASCCNPSIGFVDESTTPAIKDFLPRAKLGDSYYILVTTGQRVDTTNEVNKTKNFFTIESTPLLQDARETWGEPTIAVIDAYNIDAKMDDGLPQTGKVLALKLQTSSTLASNLRSVGATGTAATSASSTTCYDNGGVASATQRYSVGTNGGNGLNCALSIRF